MHRTLASEIATIEEVAEALGRRPSWLRNNWRRLARDNNFPRPLPGSDYDRWSSHALAAWLRTGGRVVSQDDDAGDLVSRARAAIHAELGVGQ